MNSRLAVEGDKRPGGDYEPYQSNTKNISRRPNNQDSPKRPFSYFIEARRLRLHWENDSERVKAVNFVALPIVELEKWTMMKLGGWKGPVIPMPSGKCLVITESFFTIVRADIRQPNRFTTISAMQLEKYHGMMPNSWPKSLPPRMMNDHEIELLPEAQASMKNAYHRQRNWVQLPNVAQFGYNAQTNSPTRRSQFEIDGSRHSVLLRLVDRPYVGNNPQVHRFAKKWEQMANIARACLEKASR
ncbi:RNA-directed DNA polymerase-like protein [Cucumis melo var. makuwa]|uniref:RNA-directed DNA polymerase-like protein n=1 Tax=Cucumis melo var. makuwa TaxID=1194695 RepID=A0A5A7SSQ2_CUCMM|nr:RNA-directed DNA polymerase-like protein [Cucumis melo var. makuwa]TYK17065.1 RNA-directed DNA polymerase-like protein [Cucumis melo var. makuwa]